MSENLPTDQPPRSVKNDTSHQIAKLNSPWFVWPAAGGLAVLLYFGLHYLNFALTHETTDDAFIAAHVVSIAPRVAGQVSAVHVLDNEMVHSNDLLVEIDPSDYAITVAQKQSAAESQEANYKAFLAAYELMHAKVATAEAGVRQANADADADAATAKRAEADFQRMETLRTENTISQQEFDSAQAAAKNAQANLAAAQENMEVQMSKVQETKAQLMATEAGISMALSQWQGSKTNVEAANLNLSYTKIFAPGDGRVTRRMVESGDYIQVGQMLMAIAPVDVWVVANFKESQLKKMKPGQPALVTIDALGGRIFRAHVDSIQAGSGAAFSLLPPENATGNYVKVVQRVPVKIVFDESLPADHTIGPGLSTIPSVQVSSFSTPAWAIGLLALLLTGSAVTGFRFVLDRKLAMPLQ